MHVLIAKALRSVVDGEPFLGRRPEHVEHVLNIHNYSAVFHPSANFLSILSLVQLVKSTLIKVYKRLRYLCTLVCSSPDSLYGPISATVDFDLYKESEAS